MTQTKPRSVGRCSQWEPEVSAFSILLLREMKLYFVKHNSSCNNMTAKALTTIAINVALLQLNPIGAALLELGYSKSTSELVQLLEYARTRALFSANHLLTEDIRTILDTRLEFIIPNISKINGIFLVPEGATSKEIIQWSETLTNGVALSGSSTQKDCLRTYTSSGSFAEEKDNALVSLLGDPEGVHQLSTTTSNFPEDLHLLYNEFVWHPDEPEPQTGHAEVMTPELEEMELTERLKRAASNTLIQTRMLINDFHKVVQHLHVEVPPDITLEGPLAKAISTSPKPFEGFLQIFNFLVYKTATFETQMGEMLDQIHKSHVTQQTILLNLRTNHDDLKEQLEESHKTIEQMAERWHCAEVREAQSQAAKDALKNKKQNKQRRPLRTQSTFEDMLKVLSHVKGSTPFFIARDRITILLMHLFGLRIGNIRLITKQMLKDLVDNKPIDIRLLKDRQNASFRLAPSEVILSWLLKYKEDFKIIMDKQDLPYGDPFYKVARETLTRRINGYFKEAGEDSHKYLRSHSARIGLATKGIETIGVEKTQLLLGHLNIGTTMMYNRNHMTAVEQSQAYDTLHTKPAQTKPGRGRPKFNKYTLKLGRRKVQQKTGQS